MMGLEEDPEDHKAVAASIFIAVAVYGVWSFPPLLWLILTPRRASFCFAAHKHIFMYGQVVEGLSHCSDMTMMLRIDGVRWR